MNFLHSKDLHVYKLDDKSHKVFITLAIYIKTITNVYSIQFYLPS